MALLYDIEKVGRQFLRSLYYIDCIIFYAFALYFCFLHKPATVFLKRTTKLYFMYYSRLVSILFSKDLYMSAFSTYSFGKTRFSSFVFLYLWLLIFSVAVCFEFNHVSFMKYLSSVVSLIFLPKTLIWNKTTFSASNSLNFAELVGNELMKNISKKIYQYSFFFLNYRYLL